MLSVTVVNAGFSRRVYGRNRRTRLEWHNVQNIAVPLPMSMFGTPEFRRQILALTNLGGEWRLEGYCLPHSEAAP